MARTAPHDAWSSTVRCLRGNRGFKSSSHALSSKFIPNASLPLRMALSGVSSSIPSKSPRNSSPQKHNMGENATTYHKNSSQGIKHLPHADQGKDCRSYGYTIQAASLRWPKTYPSQNIGRIDCSWISKGAPKEILQDWRQEEIGIQVEATGATYFQWEMQN